MKISFYLVLILMPLSLFGQMTQNWNYQNQLNPATNGLFYKHEANLAYSFPNRDYPVFSNSILGSYSTYLEKSKIGVGANVLNHSIPIIPEEYNDLNLKVAANRQFSIKEDMIASGGIGVGIIRYPYFYMEENEVKTRNSTMFSADLGLAFRYRRLNFATSINHFLGDGVIDSNDLRPSNWNAFLSYTFGNRERFEIIPNISYAAIAGFQNVQAMLLASYKSKYILGAGIALNNNWISTIGLTLKNTYRITYSYTRYYSPLSNYNSARHEVGLGFFLKKRDLY